MAHHVLCDIAYYCTLGMQGIPEAPNTGDKMVSTRQWRQVVCSIHVCILGCAPPPLVQRPAKAQKVVVRPGGGLWTSRSLTGFYSQFQKIAAVQKMAV